MRISDWSSDVCSSDLTPEQGPPLFGDGRSACPTGSGVDRAATSQAPTMTADLPQFDSHEQPAAGQLGHQVENFLPPTSKMLPAYCWRDLHIGRASCRERVCQCV